MCDCPSVVLAHSADRDCWVVNDRLLLLASKQLMQQLIIKYAADDPTEQVEPDFFLVDCEVVDPEEA